MALLLTSSQATPIANAIIYLLKKRKIPWKSLIVDNGKEFANPKAISQKADVNVYFCHSYASYERGLNKNHNGLLRRYFPKNKSFEDLTQSHMEAAVEKLNKRPRKLLGYLSPKQYFAKVIKQER